MDPTGPVARSHLTMASIWSVRLKNDVDANLVDLHVSGTYSGLYLGCPDDELNSRIVASATRQAESLVKEWPVYLVNPKVTFHEFAPDFAKAAGKRGYPKLPTFLCIGHFVSSQTRDPDKHGSALTVVWFQDSPPVQGIDVQLDDLDWWNHAHEFWY